MTFGSMWGHDQSKHLWIVSQIIQDICLGKGFIGGFMSNDLQAEFLAAIRLMASVAEGQMKRGSGATPIRLLRTTPALSWLED